MKFSAKPVLPLIAGFALLAMTALSAAWLSAQQQSATDWVRHTLAVESQLNLIRSLVTDAELGRSGYLLTREPVYLRLYQDAVRRLPPELDELQTATSDNPAEQSEIARLRPLIRRKIDRLGATVALARIGRTTDAAAFMKAGMSKDDLAAIRAVLARMSSNEEQLLARRTRRAERSAALVRTVRIASAALFILLAIYAIWDARRRLIALEETNDRLRSEISEKRVAQSQVRQLQKMEAVGRLTGGIAHDFNNMLGVIIGSLDLARRRLTGSEDPKLQTLLANASGGAERAAALTAKLLAFSRQQPLEPKVLDANRLVSSMSEMLRRTLGEHIEVENVQAGGLWNICADQPQLESALVNLAVNARDAMPTGGKLTIETANAELDERYAVDHEELEAGQYVMICVTDTGVGMPAEVMDRAFDPFYTTKEVGRGTGLGLSQVFGFVKQSRGHVQIYSEVGQGTTVKIYLPRYAGADDEVSEKTTVALSPRGRAEEVILVAEDDDRVRDVSVDALRELGYTVLHARNGTEALERIRSQPRLDLLLTDIVMPGMNGKQLADAALNLVPELKILYTTGYTRNAIVHNGTVDYGVAFLAKPFSIASLAKKVREVLDAR